MKLTKDEAPYCCCHFIPETELLPVLPVLLPAIMSLFKKDILFIYNKQTRQF
ncbi:MAG: hypothetical protein KL787_05825 [Taibaiella sp.]|nr:hypothetical protein [Taibaiella sp.]